MSNKTSKGRPRSLTEVQRKRVHQQRKRGMTADALAKQYKVSPITIYRACWSASKRRAWNAQETARQRRLRRQRRQLKRARTRSRDRSTKRARAKR